MNVRNVSLAAATALSLIVAPTLAQAAPVSAASKLSVRNYVSQGAVRTGAHVTDANKLSGGSVIIALLAAAAVVAGIIIAADNNGSATSN